MAWLTVEVLPQCTVPFIVQLMYILFLLGMPNHWLSLLIMTFTSLFANVSTCFILLFSLIMYTLFIIIQIHAAIHLCILYVLLYSACTLHLFWVNYWRVPMMPPYNYYVGWSKYINWSRNLLSGSSLHGLRYRTSLLILFTIITQHSWCFHLQSIQTEWVCIKWYYMSKHCW